MELDSLLGSGRWNILEILAIRPSSPLELSLKLKTSVAYISQQLKLLEAGGIIHKEKTGAATKGQPRNLYHISKEFLHLTLVVKGNPKRKSISINEHQKIILNIWLSPDEKIHQILEKIFWNVEEELNEIDGMYLDISKPKKVLYVVSGSKKIASKVNSLAKVYHPFLEISLESKESKKDFSSFYSLYNPLYLIGEKMKGGNI